MLYFEKFLFIETEFEILNLPKKFDFLIISPIQPIGEYVKIFTYFRKYNFIDLI